MYLVNNMTLCFIHYQIPYLNPLTEYGLKYIFRRKSSFKFLKRLATALDANAPPSRNESVQKIVRQEIEGFTQLLKKYISCVPDADLNEEEILGTLTLFSWYIHRSVKIW